MNLFEATEARVSCRAYADRIVEPGKIEQIESRLNEINERSGLHLQLYGPRTEGGDAVTMSKSMFTGPVYHYIACVCKPDDESMDRLGYHGEELALLATRLGLGTCWVASTFDRDTCRVEIGEGEEFPAIISIGYAMEKTPIKQRTIRAGLRKRDKPLLKLMAGDVEAAPEWFRSGVLCASKGPTAANLQPVVFTWEDGMTSADIPEKSRPIQDVDLGICKLHFEIGSGRSGTWEWGPKGRFIVE